ncbi:MAG: GTPase [Phycisphaerae bacterium]
MFDTADTIVAVSSPAPPAPRGIVRLSGPRAVALAAEVFRLDAGPTRDASLDAAPAWRRLVGHVRVAGTDLPASAILFRRPRSYTRDDLVELHLCGAPGVLALLLDALVEAGARLAGPGEFTARAYLAGALDWEAAQAVAALIAARTDEQLAAAHRAGSARVAGVAAAARESLLDLLSLVEGALDFADEPIEFITPGELRDRLARVATDLEATSAAAVSDERFGQPPAVLLTGPANAGKSTLLNRLCGRPRAIVAPRAGTTRDVLAAPLALPRGTALLLDSAGDVAAPEALDQAATRAAARAARFADLWLFVVDGAASPLPTPPREADFVVVNQADRMSPAQRAAAQAWLASLDCPGAIVSALSGAGCDALPGAIAARLNAQSAERGAAQFTLAAEFCAALRAAGEAARSAMARATQPDALVAQAELIAFDLHEAADRLAPLAGAIPPDDLLERVFRRFCIGK